MKRMLFGSLFLLVYFACIGWLASVLSLTGVRLILFWILLGLLGAGAFAFVMWFQARLDKSSGATASGADAMNLAAMLRDADRKLRDSPHGVKSLATAPILYVIGEENSAKTQTMLQSGLDAELIVGNLYRDGGVAPTQLVNIWLAGAAVVVEAGGALLSDPKLWQQLMRTTQPGRIGSVFSKQASQPTRAAVLCVSIERLAAPGSANGNVDAVRTMGQSMNERLRQLSQTLGISLPVYVLFTKLDTLPHFADYAGQFNIDEIKAPLGAMVAPLEAGSGLYAERAAALLSERFDELVYSLAEFRLNILSRGGDQRVLASAYEFPRDLQKRRGSIIDYLVELTRPSQLGINPFLRGFFFSGMRGIIREIAAPERRPVQPLPAVDAGATRVFSLGSVPREQPGQQPVRGGTRRVPQWVFLPHLFARLLLNDQTALDASRLSNRTSPMRRGLLIALCVCIAVLLGFITASFFNNRSLEQQAIAAIDTPASSLLSGQTPTLGELQRLDKVGSLLLTLSTYRKDGAPMLYRWGLYSGEQLYPVVCQAYATRFRTLLLNDTQIHILTQLRSVQSPPAPEADYSATHNPLKAYLITTSNPEKSTVDFLAPVLMSQWPVSATSSSDVARVAQTQFETYARLLPDPGSCLAGAGGAADQQTIAHARSYLGGFGGFQHVYQSMIAAAGRKFPTLIFNDKFPGSARIIVDRFPVPGAFTKSGFAFMQDAIQHPDPYFNGEEWVLGPMTGPSIDRAKLPGQLQTQYVQDYLTTWRGYLNAAHFTGYQSLTDAADKLSVLDSNASPLLQLFSLLSNNTAVASPEIVNAFQSPQSVVPPNNPEGRFTASTNEGYIQALQQLEGAIKTVSQNPLSSNDPGSAAPILSATSSADQAAKNLQGRFIPDTAGHMDAVSFARLEDPIKAAVTVAQHIPGNSASGAAANFCSQANPVLAKFPFNPQAMTEATAEEVAMIFSPGQALSQFTSRISQLVVLQGGQYVPAPGSAMGINGGFLSFLNAAQKVSTSLFPAGGTQPTLTFGITESKVPGTPDGTLNIDGQQINAGQSAAIRWMSQPSSRVTLVAEQIPAPPMTGPWSVFHFGFAADHPTPSRMEFPLQFGGTKQIVRFDTDGAGTVLLDKRFMSKLHCTSSVVRQ